MLFGLRFLNSRWELGSFCLEGKYFPENVFLIFHCLIGLLLAKIFHINELKLFFMSDS